MREIFLEVSGRTTGNGYMVIMFRNLILIAKMVSQEFTSLWM